MALECANTPEHTNFADLSPFANRALKIRLALRCAVPLFLELHHGSVGCDFDFPVDDRPLGNGDRARADPAAYYRGIADFQLILDAEGPHDLARDNRLLRLYVPMPTSGGRQIERAIQFPVAVHFAGYHELTAAADIADEHGGGADKGRRGLA